MLSTPHLGQKLRRPGTATMKERMKSTAGSAGSMTQERSTSTACLLMDTTSSRHLPLSQAWFVRPTEHLPPPHAFLPPLVVTPLGRFHLSCTELEVSQPLEDIPACSCSGLLGEISSLVTPSSPNEQLSRLETPKPRKTTQNCLPRFLSDP